MENLTLEKRQLCDIQGRLFELALKNGYDCPAFIEAFMNSNAAAALDDVYDRLQWAGEEYILEELNDEVCGLKKAGTTYTEEVMYWAGYTYRYWHYYKNESSREIYQAADAKTMNECWLGFHTFDVEMAIDDLKEIDKQKRNNMKLVQFQEKFRQAFIDFNTDWIVSNFGFLEEHDKETFEKIDEELNNGAMIFFAVEDDIPLACCMSMPMKDDTWEICKLGSNKNVPHKGAGDLVFKASMEWAKEHGAKRLFIISNSKLKPALHIYEKNGFKEIKLDDYEYVRGDIAFEYFLEE